MSWIAILMFVIMAQTGEVPGIQELGLIHGQSQVHQNLRPPRSFD